MKILQEINQRVQKIANFIFLHLVYFLGIGATSLIARLAGKRFLEMKPKNSTWRKYTGSKDWERMY